MIVKKIIIQKEDLLKEFKSNIDSVLKVNFENNFTFISNIYNENIESKIPIKKKRIYDDLNVITKEKTE